MNIYSYMENNVMKISIITVVWNNKDTIKDAIDSVLNQTYRRYRIYHSRWFFSGWNYRDYKKL